MIYIKGISIAAISLLMMSGSVFADPAEMPNSSKSDQCKQVAETLCRHYKKKGKKWYQWCLREQYGNCMHQNPPR